MTSKQQFIARGESDQAVLLADVWKLLESVKDPEIPVLSILDLGVLRDVMLENQSLTVVITPTYCGCPALDTIQDDIRTALAELPVERLNIHVQLAPPWTTDWITSVGRQNLLDFGIAPPTVKEVSCPRCQSLDTRLVSEFGSTACKALYRCEGCLEPFDYFKCL
jgi:ring-1,2-phenylacetyl-CoA epoxidase subunit PaaD